MKRLLKRHKNSPHEYEQIFVARRKKGVDQFDLRRWKTLLKHYKDGRLIDLGCLDSLVSDMAFKKSGDEIWGIDQAENVIWNMEKKFPDTNWEIGDVYETRFPDRYFDYAVLGEVLEHLEKPWNAVKEALRILKKGGVLAISVPLNEAIEPGAVDGERHVWSFTEEDIKEFVKPHKVEFMTLRSIKKPYQYCFPQLIAFIWK